MTAAALPRAASRQALAVLRHPDRRTTWAIVLAASLDVARRPSQDRVDALHAELPIIGARLDGEVWVPGGPPRVVDVGSHEPTEAPDLLDGFSLDRDAPLRVVVGGVGGGRVALVGHHAAFDGRGLVAVLGALLGGDVPNSVAGVSPGRLRPQLATVRRLVRPADRIAPSRVAPARDSVVARDAVLGGHDVTARLAAACAQAAQARNRSQRAPLRRFGISVGVGGMSGVGNVASYRRVDVRAPGDVLDAVNGALTGVVEPAELVGSSRALRALSPLVSRLSDTLLISNLGRIDVPGARRVEFYPVARGRSAVSFGAASVAGGDTTLTVRCRDLDASDAAALLEDAVSRLADSGG